MGPSVTPGWWRRNTAALVAVAVLVPSTALIVGGPDWWDEWRSHPIFPTTVAAGQSSEYAGASWGPVHVGTRVAADDLPEGTKVIDVEVPVDPGSEDLVCSPPTLRELRTDREWSESTSELELDYDPGRTTLCGIDGGGPFTLAVSYLVPVDAVGPFGLDLVIADQAPGFLRLVVAP